MVQPRTGEVMPPRVTGGTSLKIAPEADRRQSFAGWLTDPKNPYFAPAIEELSKAYAQSGYKAEAKALSKKARLVREKLRK